MMLDPEHPAVIALKEKVGQNSLSATGIWKIAFDLAHEYIDESDFYDWGMLVVKINKFAREAIIQAGVADRVGIATEAA